MIFDVKESNIDSLKNITEIDYLIIAIGYENRASYLAELMLNIKVKNRICIKLVSDPNPEQKKIIDDFGFQYYEIKDLELVLEKVNGNLIIDYSVMMKQLYADILKYFMNTKRITDFDIYFSYTHGIFESKKDKKFLFVKSIEPILSTESKIIENHRSKKLIISLGYERLSAIGIIENLEINYEDVIVLINKDSKDEKFYEECLIRNKTFLDNLKSNQIIEFDFFNFHQTLSVLDSLLFKLKMDNHQAIISPMSVKSFSLLSMIISLQFDNLLFYNVTSLNNSSSHLKFPDKTRDPYIYKVKKMANSKTVVL